MPLMYQIKHGLPIPTNRYRLAEYHETFDAMEVNDYIELGSDKEFDRVTAAAYRYGTRFNKKFTGQKSTLRMWRKS